MFKSSWGRTGDHKLWSRVHGSVKESTSCVQEFKGALSRVQAVSKSLWGRYGEHKLCSRVHGGVKESISCVQELMGALRRVQAVFKS